MFADSHARLVIGAPGDGRLALRHGGRKSQVGQTFAACSGAFLQPCEVPKREKAQEVRKHLVFLKWSESLGLFLPVL